MPHHYAIVQAGRIAGVGLVIAGLVLGLTSPSSPLDGGWWWRLVLYAFSPINVGMIVLVLVCRLNGESTRWVPPVAAVLFAATVAYAILDTGNPVSSRQPESDAWAAINFFVSRSPLVALLLILGTDSTKVAKSVLAFSEMAFVCSLAIALHTSSPFDGHSIWGFMGDVSRSGAAIALPAIVALAILGARPGRLRAAALAAGVLVLLLGFADSLWFASRIPSDSSWFFLLNMTGYFGQALLLVVAGRALTDAKQLLAICGLIAITTIASAVWYANLLEVDKAWSFGIVAVGHLGMLAVALLWWQAWPPMSDEPVEALPSGLVEA